MSVAYLTSLDYTFPVYDNTSETNQNIPRDVLLSQTLKLDRFAPITPPIQSDAPMNNIISPVCSQKISPLDDLLQLSRERIKKMTEQNGKSVPPPIRTESIAKRYENDRKSTPVTNKTIFFSPSGKGKKLSTPVAKRKTSINLKQKLLKMDQASLVSMTKPLSTIWGQTAQPEEHHEDILDADLSDYDYLACHADNIMRMAVDSTMLGSTFNSSFSSSFSNSFSAEHAGKDFFDKEAKRSILEGLNF